MDVSEKAMDILRQIEDAKLGMDELRILNSAIVTQLKAMRSLRDSQALLNLHRNTEVEFAGRKGRTLKGIITGFTKKYVHVKATHERYFGNTWYEIPPQNWKCSPALLKLIKKEAKASEQPAEAVGA